MSIAVARPKRALIRAIATPVLKSWPNATAAWLAPRSVTTTLGTCREPDWADQHCMTDHIVYLANSSGIKVGITRHSQIPTRWIDQGAVQALPILRVATRQQSGLVETLFKQAVADKTNWRKMLKGEVETLDLNAAAEELLQEFEAPLSELQERFGFNNIQRVEGLESKQIDYPVDQYPTKVATHNFDKSAVVSGNLQGIKGQYLILDTGVLNVRKFTSYKVQFSVQ